MIVEFETLFFWDGPLMAFCLITIHLARMMEQSDAVGRFMRCWGVIIANTCVRPHEDG
jgi:hypothetical protein